MKFIDTHIHLQDYKQKCATDIIASAKASGAEKLVCAAIVEKDWERIASLAESNPDFVIPAFGLHPWYLEEANKGWEQRLESFLSRFPSALVGETGLDRIRFREKEPQFQIFQTHVALAKKHCRPLLIHAVKAAEWLEECWNNLPQKFVMHSFNGRFELMQKALAAGGFISFSASIFANADKERIISSVPADKLLVETDGPYQAAEKGAESEPSSIPEQIEKIASIRGEEPEKQAEQILKNSLEFIKPW